MSLPTRSYPVVLQAAALIAAASLCVSITGESFAQGRTEPSPQQKAPDGKAPQPAPKGWRPGDSSREAPGKGGKNDKGAEADKGGKEGARAAHPKLSLKAPGSSIPIDPVKRARLLKDLYAFLATAEDKESAGQITEAIERVWMAAAGDTVAVLLDRAVKAAATERPDLALSMLDTVTRIAPDFPEGFNRRAYVYYGLNEYERALGDLRRVLALEPNHYKALEGLGQILKETDRKKAALEVYRRLVEVHPFASGAKTTLEELERVVAGQGS